MRVASVALPFLLCLTIISFAYSHGNIDAPIVCNQNEKEALLEFKQGLKDPSNRLSSWGGADANCCRWYGVICDNFTGHVTELHLRMLSSEEYDSSETNFGYYLYEEYAEMYSLGGQVSESLLNLKHLKYLDLSNNDFGGIPIPKFLGSIESLRYLNLSNAGFEGKIPHELGNLSNLQYLDLNLGDYSRLSPLSDLHIENLHWLSGLRSLKFLDLSYVSLTKTSDWLDVLNSLPSLVELHLSGCELDSILPPLLNVNFSSLTTLDLSHTRFPQVPSWIFHLKTLTSLALSGTDFFPPFPMHHLQNLTRLRELHLQDCNLHSSTFDWLPGFTHLQVLDLSFNKNLQGRIPSSIGNLTSLISLHMSSCQLKGEIPTAIGDLTLLENLVLADNSLEGGIPTAIGNLTFLSSIDLSSNNLEGAIPIWFKNLCNLRYLDLSKNKLSQEMNEVLEILSECASDKLGSLILPYNKLSGHLSHRLLKFRSLADLELNANLISGPIPENLGELNSLTKLYLGDNKLNGSLPVGFGMLAKLKEVDISNNLLEGEIFKVHFANLTNLATFGASGNRLILRVTSDWVPPFQNASTIYLGSWHVGPQFPTWIRSLKFLACLDLSNSGILGTLPMWFHNFSSSLYLFNLSHNQISGKISRLSIDESYYGSWIDLNSNHFEGSLPYVSSYLNGLDLSNNSFSGSISSFLCDRENEFRTMQVLNLGDNHFSGEIPDCWMNWELLRAIRLSNNNFSGNIPTSIGTLIDLQMLNLDNNNLSGEFPFSLANCTMLEVLDLSENELRGEVPTWMGVRFQWMIILSLRGNKFHGNIPEELCHINGLRILDISANNLNGTIPRCINNLTAMFAGTDDIKVGWVGNDGSSLPYFESSSIMRSGRMTEYSTILYFVRALDLSNNKLSGEIPEEITSLGGLQSLNLSRNFLTGKIPKNIGAMKALESLDFSQNQLSGEIPPSMSNLTFLAYLNLSNNKLSGIIPSSTQLQSFDPSSFSGNNLCGLPLPQNCSVDEGNSGIDKGRTDDNVNGDDGAVDWFYFSVSIAPGFVVGFWAVIGPLVFNRRWRNLYFNFLSDVWNKVWVWFHVYIVRVVNRQGA